jgi:hypothetical protein
LEDECKDGRIIIIYIDLKEWDLVDWIHWAPGSNQWEVFLLLGWIRLSSLFPFNIN